MRNQLNRQIDFLVLKDNLGNHSLNLIQQANTLLNYVDNSLQIIYPLKRSKRGLINFGGKISKWLFGTLDADDGKRINLILNHLNKNDHLLQERINEQITLEKDIMTKTNHSLYQIKSNLLLINQIIDQFSERVNEVNTLNLIINSLTILQIHLNQITNAITFANLNKIHPTFLPLENLYSILKKIDSFYPPTQIVQFKNYQSYYTFLGIQLLYKDDKIVFLIHFPILKPNNFKTYFIYPIPIDNKIIPPQKPYLILNERNDLYQYQEKPCEEVETISYCNNNLQADEDCVVEIMKKNQPTNCSTIPVHLNQVIANQVTPHHVLLTTPKEINLIERCSTEKHHKLKSGSYLITISNNCQLSINQEMFVSENENVLPAIIIELPQLNISNLPQRSKRIQLSKLDLDEIKHLTAKVNIQHEMNILEDPSSLEDTSFPIWVHILIYLSISFIFLLAVICYYRSCYPYPYPLPKRKNKVEEMEMVEQP